MTEYMTTKELAEFLRIKQRKVYALAASGRVPCSRAMGKLLFPRAEVEAWVAAGGVGGRGFVTPARALADADPLRSPRPPVFLGSHDPLLEWALRQSRCGLATYFDGTLDGLDGFERRRGVATGLHLHDDGGGPEMDPWNVPVVEARFGRSPVVLVEWAWRDRGLIVAEKQMNTIKGIADLAGHIVVPRQPEAATQIMLENLLRGAGLHSSAVTWIEAARTETDAAIAVKEGRAHAALGLKGVARQYNLGYRPLTRERFDLLVDRKAWFDPPMQTFLAFCGTDEFHDKAQSMTGYDVSHMGIVRFNGA